MHRKTPSALLPLLFGVMAIVAATAASAQSAPCPTSDDVLVQGMLDSAGAGGGGTVQLDARAYQTCRPLIVPSNVHLRGAGRRATIIKSPSGVPFQTIVVGNSTVYGSIAVVGAANFSITDLTVDHQSVVRDTNGIVLLPKGLSTTNTETYDGAAPWNGLIERVEVLGASTTDHNYLIWNLRGQHIKIIDNWCDGNSNPSLHQEGIESYGGYDVVIAHNTVQNVGNACVNVGSAGIASSETAGIFITENYLNRCETGVSLGTSNLNGGNFANAHTQIRGNVILSPRQQGVLVVVAPGTTERDLSIAQNTIRNVNVDLTRTSAAGIELRAPGLAASGIVNNLVENNRIDAVRGANGHGIRINQYPNLRVHANAITGTAAEGIVLYTSGRDIELSDNRIEESGTRAIDVSASPAGAIQRLVIARNSIPSWTGSSSAIAVNGVTYLAVRDNVFGRTDTLTPDPITLANSCSVTTSGNLAWYAATTLNPAPAPCP
jgi:hypothetical protein